MPTFKDNSNEFERALSEVERRKLGKIAAIVSRKARETCVRLTGALARSIHVVIEGRTARIGSNLDYAPVVELGAKPHIIRPRRKRALFWRDAKHPYALVRHPGVKDRPFLRPALIGSAKEIELVLKEKD